MKKKKSKKKGRKVSRKHILKLKEEGIKAFCEYRQTEVNKKQKRKSRPKRSNYYGQYIQIIYTPMHRL